MWKCMHSCGSAHCEYLNVLRGKQCIWSGVESVMQLLYAPVHVILNLVLPVCLGAQGYVKVLDVSGDFHLCSLWPSVLGESRMGWQLPGPCACTHHSSLWPTCKIKCKSGYAMVLAGSSVLDGGDCQEHETLAGWAHWSPQLAQWKLQGR